MQLNKCNIGMLISIVSQDTSIFAHKQD